MMAIGRWSASSPRCSPTGSRRSKPPAPRQSRKVSTPPMSFSTSWPASVISRQLIRVWVQKYEAGALDEDAQAADLLQEYEAKIAALHGWPTSARNRVPKGGSEKRTAAEKREYICRRRPRGVSIAGGCRLMGIGRSAFYDTPRGPRARPEHRCGDQNDLRRVRNLWLSAR